MHTLLKRHIIDLAKATPFEVCGYFYRDHAGQARTYECRNVAADPTKEFEISQDEQIALLGMGDPLGIYHSHPVGGDLGFSPADLENAEVQDLPFYLYTVENDQWHEYLPPDYHVDLVGRRFALGFSDCFGLIRDHFRQTEQLYISDYDRDESFLHEEQGVIMANFRREGFVLGSLETLQPNHILMFKSEKALPQHFAVYRGAQLMLHHPQNALSREEQLSGRWLSRLVCVFRRETEAVSV